MTPSQVVVIGGSAGAIPSIIEIVRHLPPSFNLPICIVVHIHPDSTSVLPTLVESASGIPTTHAQDQDILKPRHIYIAPPDRHMLLEGKRLLVHRGAHENRSRPAIDPLFRSAALSFGTNVIALLLSGYLDDGTAGLLAVKRQGGVVIVQDPNDTIFRAMPSHALESVKADFVLPLSAIAQTLARLARPQGAPLARNLSAENDGMEIINENIMTRVMSGDNPDLVEGKLTTFTCPQCNGTLWEIADEKLTRYRCHEGHAFSQNSLVMSQNEALENALWVALRALDDKVALHQRLLHRAEQLDQHRAAMKYVDTIDNTLAHANHIREILKSGPAYDPCKEKEF